jgi:hypothetical protein
MKLKTKIKPSTSIGLNNQIDYGKLTLLELENRIANSSDKQALKEINDNRQINHQDHKHSFRPAEYIEMLKSQKRAWQWCGHDTMVLEEAYNRTIDKFCNMPDQTDNEHPKLHGPDCRLYFSACFNYTTILFKENPPANAIEAEIIASKMLRRMIDRQFYFSCLEARRKENKFARRYRWELDQGDLYLLIPWEVPRQRCREWLQANIGQVDPQRHGEKERVQTIIDKLFLKKKIFFLSELHEVEEKLPPDPDALSLMMEEQVTVDGLAETVADEKAENIKDQRRTIQMLGKEKLKKLIHSIFNALAHGEYVEHRIAASYGLSPATFSRFAGVHWNKNCDDVSSVPALWSNVAHTLAGHLKFVMEAKKAGVLKQVSGILKAEQIRENLR